MPRKKGILKKPGQRKKTPQRLIQVGTDEILWEKSIPNIENLYFESGYQRRVDLMCQYVIKHISGHFDEKTDRDNPESMYYIPREEENETEEQTLQRETRKRMYDLLKKNHLKDIKKTINDSYTLALNLEPIAKSINSWTTCKKLLNDEGFQNLMIGKASEKKLQAYVKTILPNIEADPDEIKFREKRAAAITGSKDLRKRFNKLYPNPEQYYQLKASAHGDNNARKYIARQYLVMNMMDYMPDKNEFEVRDLVNSIYGEKVLNAVEYSVKGWNTFLEVINNPELHKHLAACSGDKPPADAEKALTQYLKNTINPLQNRPDEIDIREKIGLIQIKPADVKLDLENIYSKTDDLVTALNAVDFNLAGTGSDAFNKMKTTIKKYQAYTREYYVPDIKTHLISEDMHREFLGKTLETIQSIRGYLDYKADQFKREPDRRNSDRRQKREQPRILAAVSMLEDMEKFYFEQSLSIPGRRHRDKDAEEVKRTAFLAEVATQKKKYLTNLASRQSKDKMPEKLRNGLYNEQDKADAARLAKKNASKQKIAKK